MRVAPASCGRVGSYGGSVVSEVAPEIGALARLETKAGDHFVVKIVGVEMKIAAEGFQTEYVCRTENLPREGDDNGGHPSFRKGRTASIAFTLVRRRLRLARP